MEQQFYLWDYLIQTKKNIVIYGMGDGCDKILGVCREKGIPVRGIFASDEYVRNKTVHGFPIRRFSEIRKDLGEVIVLLAFGVFRPDLMEKILRMNEDVELYAPEVPLFGGGLFDREYDLLHRERWQEVEEMLADEASRRVLRSILEYRRSGRILPLIEAESEKTADLAALVPYRKGDVYVDLGAYDGDTVLEWTSLHPDHGAVYAVEPSPKTFRKMMASCKDVRDFTGIEAAVWNADAPLSFNAKGGRSAAVDQTGKDTVRGIRVDSAIPRADFIKFDVEGAEKEALEGAEALIRRDKPTLCVSCYHRTEDLFAIPLQVKRILPEYRVYLRHQPYVPAWDTVYYFVAR
ncbi:MAG: FkbM family methyltransferase [Clostridia bacterium]|nr:FkbM family methyltransferase [Clostridia bacterium]